MPRNGDGTGKQVSDEGETPLVTRWDGGGGRTEDQWARRQSLPGSLGGGKATVETETWQVVTDSEGDGTPREA